MLAGAIANTKQSESTVLKLVSTSSSDEVNAFNADGSQPLVAAVLRGSLALVEALIDRGAQVNPQQMQIPSNDTAGGDPYNVAPLFWAIVLGHDAIAASLLVEGATLSTPAIAGSVDAVQPSILPLPPCAADLPLVMGDVHIARLLCERDGAVAAVPADTSQQLSDALSRRLAAELDPAHARGSYGWLVELRTQLRERAEGTHGENGMPRATNKLLASACSTAVLRLGAAAFDGNPGTVAELVRAGVSVNSSSCTSPASVGQGRVDPPLISAARHNHVLCVEVLLAAGADVAVKDAQSRTALHVAAASGVTHVVQALCGSSSAQMALRMKDADGCTPRELSLRRGHDGVTQMLLDKEIAASRTPAINDSGVDGVAMPSRSMPGDDVTHVHSSKRTVGDVPARVDVRFNFNGGSTAVPRSFVDSADFGTGCFPLHFGIVAPGTGTTSRIVSVRNEHATLGVVADIISQRSTFVTASSMPGQWLVRQPPARTTQHMVALDVNVGANGTKTMSDTADSVQVVDRRAEMVPRDGRSSSDEAEHMQAVVPPRSRSLLLIEFVAATGGNNSLGGCDDATGAQWALSNGNAGVYHARLVLGYEDGSKLALAGTSNSNQRRSGSDAGFPVPLQLPLCVRVGRVQLQVLEAPPSGLQEGIEAGQHVISTVDFATDVGGAQWKAVHLHNTGTLPMQANLSVELGLTSDAVGTSAFSAQPQYVRLLPRASCEALVLFTPQLAGLHRASLVVRYAPDPQVLPEAAALSAVDTSTSGHVCRVPLSGHAKPRAQLACNVSTVNCGGIVVGSTSTVNFALRNTSNSERCTVIFCIKQAAGDRGVASTVTAFKAMGTSEILLAPRQEASVSLRFTPYAVGLHREELHINKLEGDGDHYVVPLLGFGVEKLDYCIDETVNSLQCQDERKDPGRSMHNSEYVDAIVRENTQLKRAVAMQTEEMHRRINEAHSIFHEASNRWFKAHTASRQQLTELEAQVQQRQREPPLTPSKTAAAPSTPTTAAVALGSGTVADVDVISDLSPDTDSPPPRRTHREGKFAQQLHDSRKPVARRKRRKDPRRLAFKSTGDDMVWLTCSVGQTPRRRMRLCNFSSNQITMCLRITPSTSPFWCKHSTLTVGARSCVYLPVYFAPQTAGKASATLAARAVTADGADSLKPSVSATVPLTGFASVEEGPTPKPRSIRRNKK